MAGKHVRKRTPARASVSDTGRQRGNTYVVTPSYDEYDVRPRRSAKRRRKSALPLVTVALVAVVLIGAGLYMAALNRVAALDTIYPNIMVNDVPIGGLTMEEAVQTLQDSGADPYQGKSVTVILPMENTITITAEELGLGSDVTVAAEAAYAYGRDGSMRENWETYRQCRKKTVSMRWETAPVLDETALRTRIETIVGELNEQMLNTTANIGEDGVTLLKGMQAEKVDAETLITQVREAFEMGNYEDIVVEVTAIESDGTEDAAFLQSVYETIFKEPVNAMYDKETGGVTEPVQGVSFDMETALELWAAANPGDEVFIPFVFTEPEITELSDALFSDLLSSKSTSISGSSSGRINNIELSAAAMNDTVVNPGETFDYNTCLGQRTAERGYQEAGAYSGGKHVSELGGGICQGSSTLYYCAMKANLNITVRSCHYFVVGYLPRGMDATVSWGGPDFRFVNNRDYPIKIKAWVSDGELTVQIWGTDVDGSYVDLSNETWEDDEYYYARTYRTVYAADGSVISSQQEAYSEYHKYEEGEEATPTPSPTATPEETPTPTPEVTATPKPEPTQTAEPTPEPTATPEPTPDPTPVPVEPVESSEPEEPAETDDAGGGETPEE